jgi:hypothetical protein
MWEEAEIVAAPPAGQRGSMILNERLQALAAWAEDHYPARATPPPAMSGIDFDAGTLIELFDDTSSARAHLALMDQEPIRTAVEGYRLTLEGVPVLAAVKRSWQRHHPEDAAA